MHTTRAAGLVLGLLTLLPSATFGGGPEVDRVGDLSAAVIEGAKAIPEARVRHALAFSGAVAVTGCPSAPLTDFLNTVQRNLLAGYVGDGFVQAKVRADVDASGNKLRIRIEEGPRYVWSKLRFVHGKLTDEAAVRAALTQWTDSQATPITIDEAAGTIVIATAKKRDPRLGYEAPMFEAGDPARTDLRWTRPRVIQELFRQGLCWADPKLEADLHDDGTADLVIDLSAEGPKAKIRKIAVTGASINKPQEVLAFLGLREGMPMDLSVLLAARQKLWDSGRFLRHELCANVARDHAGELDLNIDLFEHPKAPPLSQPIDTGMTDDERAVLHLESAMAQLRRNDSDFVLDVAFGGQRVDAVFNRKKGIIATYHHATASATQPATAPAGGTAGDADVSAFVIPGRLGALCSGAGHKFDVPTKRVLSVVVDFVPAEDLNAQTCTINLGFGAPEMSPNVSEPVGFSVLAAPVFFFDLVRPRYAKHVDGKPPADKPIQVERRDGAVIYHVGSGVIKTDGAAGAFVSYDIEDAAARQSIHVTMDNDAFERETARLDGGRHLANDYDPRRPATSFARFLVTIYNSLPFFSDKSVRWDNPSTGIVLKLFGGDALGVLDDQWGRPDDSEEFALPHDAAAGEGVLAMARVLLGYVDDLFPYGAWTWTVAHESGLVATGGSPYALAELRRIMSGGEMGPVGCLACATAITYADIDRARSIARIGLTKLSAKEFEKDLNVLLGNQKSGAKVLGNVLQAVGQLSDDEAAQLNHMLPAGYDQAVAYVRGVARSHPDARVADLLRQNPSEFWEKGARQIVESNLKSLAGQ